MRLLILLCVLTTGCQPCYADKAFPEPDGTSQLMKIADLPGASNPGVYVVRDYEHGQLCTIARVWEGVSISCQAWELPVP